MRHSVGVAALAILAAVGLSCDRVSGPVAGTLNVRFTSPNSGADSGVVLTISGPAALTSAEPGPGLRLFQQPLGGTTTRFALVGRLNTDATIVTVGVSDVRQAAQYTARIDQVAADNYALRSLTGYSAVVRR